MMSYILIFCQILHEYGQHTYDIPEDLDRVDIKQMFI